MHTVVLRSARLSLASNGQGGAFAPGTGRSEASPPSHDNRRPEVKFQQNLCYPMADCSWPAAAVAYPFSRRCRRGGVCLLSFPVEGRASCFLLRLPCIATLCKSDRTICPCRPKQADLEAIFFVKLCWTWHCVFPGAYPPNTQERSTLRPTLGDQKSGSSAFALTTDIFSCQSLQEWRGHERATRHSDEAVELTIGRSERLRSSSSIQNLQSVARLRSGQ